MKRIFCLLLAGAALLAPLSYAKGDNDGKRTWRDRGKDLMGAVVNAKESLDAVRGTGEERLSLQEGLVRLLDDYKEQYKEEGRAYARELGDVLVSRIREDPKISSSLTSVQVLCWVVIVYLTIVTLFMVTAVRRTRRDYARIIALLKKRQNGD